MKKVFFVLSFIITMLFVYPTKSHANINESKMNDKLYDEDLWFCIGTGGNCEDLPPIVIHVPKPKK